MAGGDSLAVPAQAAVRAWRYAPSGRGRIEGAGQETLPLCDGRIVADTKKARIHAVRAVKSSGCSAAHITVH